MQDSANEPFNKRIYAAANKMKNTSGFERQNYPVDNFVSRCVLLSPPFSLKESEKRLHKPYSI